MSARDKGAAKAIKERLDEQKRLREQDQLVAQWAGKAEQLLGAPRLNIADALAWQRDAAKAGAPLSREPLAQLKNRLAEVVRRVEDLQHQVMVQREAAVLLAQRIEVLRLTAEIGKQTKASLDERQREVLLREQMAWLLEERAGRMSPAYRRLIGDPLLKLQRLMGHSRIESTYIYLDHLDECQALIDAAVEQWGLDVSAASVAA